MHSYICIALFMWQQIILGTIQGIFEWLPVSSEGLIVLIQTNFFGGGFGAGELIQIALFLHLGTFLAALVYFRQDVVVLLKTVMNYKFAQGEEKKVFEFLVVVTIISGACGFALLKIFSCLGQQIDMTGKMLTGLVGALLLITGILQLKAKNNGIKSAGDLKIFDSVLLGLVQGLAVLPGLSRSGLTVSALLLRKFNSADSLRLSFLMSLPIVFLGNIVLNVKNFVFDLSMLLGVFLSFILGLLTIHLLLKLAQKTNFGYFVIIFGLFVFVAALI